MNPEAISLVDGFKQCLIFATKSGYFFTCAEHCQSQPMTADWESRTIHGTGRGAPSIAADPVVNFCYIAGRTGRWQPQARRRDTDPVKSALPGSTGKRTAKLPSPKL